MQFAKEGPRVKSMRFALPLENPLNDRTRSLSPHDTVGHKKGDKVTSPSGRPPGWPAFCLRLKVEFPLGCHTSCLPHAQVLPRQSRLAWRLLRWLRGRPAAGPWPA